MIALFIVLLAIGAAATFAAFSSDSPAVAIPGIVLGIAAFWIGLTGTLITISDNSDKNYCLKTLPQVSQTETKWLDGECYMKAKDGKFVPQEWIEKGYNK